MPNLYSRMTALHDLRGRIDYASNPDKQEHLMAVHDGAADLLDGQFWNILAAESQEAFEKFGQKEREFTDHLTGEKETRALKCCQGREVVLQISNSLLPYNGGDFDHEKADEIAKIAADEVSKATGEPTYSALHYNKTENNLHLHLILPERSLLKEPVIKVAERNLFFDEEGKRRYKKSEILDENKELRPGCRIVKKGEIYEQRYFGSVNQKYSSKQWLKDFKTNCLLSLRNGALKGDVEIKEFDYSTGKLPQQKVGRKEQYRDDPEAPDRIREYNRMVRRYNKLIDRGDIDLETALEIQKEILGSKRKNEPLKEQLDRLQKALEEAEAEKRKRDQEHYRWMAYKQIRDAAWEAYRSMQRVEMGEIRNCTQAMRELYEQNSTPIYNLNGQLIGRRMKSPAHLAAVGYQEKMDRLKRERDDHMYRLSVIRDYEQVAKGRQKIMRALIMAGAEQNVIDSAMREYEEASRQLQMHLQRPDRHDGRRMAAAQESLRMAEKRAEHYLQKLTAEQAAQLQAPEDCAIMEETDREYDVFQEEHQALASALEKEMAAAASGKKISLADQIAGADARQGPGSGTTVRNIDEPER